MVPRCYSYAAARLHHQGRREDSTWNVDCYIGNRTADRRAEVTDARAADARKMTRRTDVSSSRHGLHGSSFSSMWFKLTVTVTVTVTEKCDINCN